VRGVILPPVEILEQALGELESFMKRNK
jgi:hypothetical protein